MYKNINQITHHIDRIEKENKFIFEKSIPKEEFDRFNKILLKCFKKYPVIVKGSRALNQQLTNKIYNDEELKYSDYDIYCCDIENTMTNIVNEFCKRKILNVKWSMNPFKQGIYRLSFYGIPIIDADNVEKELFSKLPIITIDGIKYIKSFFQKIDMYVQLGRPTIWNIKNWEKVDKRLKLCEKEIKYEKLVSKNKNLNKDIFKIINIFGKDCIFTGNLAYYTLLGNFKYGLEYLEILTKNTKKYINDIKKIYPNIIVSPLSPFMHLMKGGYRVILNNQTLCYLWELDDCSNYFIKKGKKYSSYYYLMYYFNLIKYINKFDNIFQDWKISETILYKMYRKRREYSQKQFECLGERNPGINELKETFFKTGIQNIKTYYCDKNIKYEKSSSSLMDLI